MSSLRFAIASIATLLLASTPPSCHAFNTVPTQQHQLQAPESTRPSASSTAIFSHNDDGVDVNNEEHSNDIISSRRSFFATSSAMFVAAAAVVSTPLEANAAQTDCFKDCLKSCKLIAPKDPQYCQSNCEEYCKQEDRTDGLSGSVSSEGGEVGILGFNTVVKGEDKPPEVKLPGLDFSSGKGKKLLGY
mmetsp:Transcript_23128/g.41478  ORF Transcript_23128/g.41478 Transcript_23128/m.41478 type:complete len:189 (+) Transcript_23128:75-641(+)